jgi:hypothetical protein
MSKWLSVVLVIDGLGHRQLAAVPLPERTIEIPLPHLLRGDISNALAPHSRLDGPGAEAGVQPGNLHHTKP